MKRNEWGYANLQPLLGSFQKSFNFEGIAHLSICALKDAIYSHPPTGDDNMKTSKNLRFERMYKTVMIYTGYKSNLHNICCKLEYMSLVISLRKKRRSPLAHLFSKYDPISIF